MASVARPPARSSGFSLVEIMIVVSLISILATIAIPQYQRYVLRTKTAEAKTNLGAIRTVQTSFYSEFGLFLAAGPEPATVPGVSAVAFDDTLPQAEGILEAGHSVDAARLAEEFGDWLTKKKGHGAIVTVHTSEAASDKATRDQAARDPE